MKPAALVGALIGTAIGALLWAGVAYLTGLEIGWIAWGIGGAIGLGAALGGGNGATTGVVCAGLAVLSIFAGKWLAVDMVAEAELRKFTDAAATLDAYADLENEAKAFADLEGEDEYPWFMATYGYSEAMYEEDVTDFELAMFTSESVPQLQKFHAQKPSYVQWKKGLGDEIVREWERVGSTAEVIQENLSPLDALFALLGLVTAFSVGSKGLPSQGDIQYAPREPRSETPGDASPYGQPEPQPSAYAPSDAPILQEEPPNPFAHPSQAPAQPAAPAGPVIPRKIKRLGEPVGTPAGTTPGEPSAPPPLEPSRREPPPPYGS